MEIFLDTFGKKYKITLKNELLHTTALGTDIFGNIQRLDNLITSFREEQTSCENQPENEKVQLENAKAELDPNKKDNEIVDGERGDEETPERSRDDRDCR